MPSFNLKRFLTNPKKGLENLGRSLGEITRKGAPLASFIPGVGPGIAAGLGTLGSIAEGRNRGDHLKAGAIAGLSGYGIDKLQALKGAAGAASAGGKVIGGTGPMSGLPMPEIGAVPGGGSWLSKLGPLGGLIGGKDGKLGSILDIAKTAAKYGLPALGAYQASKTQGKANDMREKALKLLEAEYAAGAPLRSQGLAGMTDPRLQDVSALFNRPRPQYRSI